MQKIPASNKVLLATECFVQKNKRKSYHSKRSTNKRTSCSPGAAWRDRWKRLVPQRFNILLSVCLSVCMYVLVTPHTAIYSIGLNFIPLLLRATSSSIAGKTIHNRKCTCVPISDMYLAVPILVPIASCTSNV